MPRGFHGRRCKAFLCLLHDQVHLQHFLRPEWQGVGEDAHELSPLPGSSSTPVLGVLTQVPRSGTKSKPGLHSVTGCEHQGCLCSCHPQAGLSLPQLCTYVPVFTGAVLSFGQVPASSWETQNQRVHIYLLIEQPSTWRRQRKTLHEVHRQPYPCLAWHCPSATQRQPRCPTPDGLKSAHRLQCRGMTENPKPV